MALHFSFKNEKVLFKQIMSVLNKNVTLRKLKYIPAILIGA
jgi:hypothetical protein